MPLLRLTPLMVPGFSQEGSILSRDTLTALTPALSQTWEREQETPLLAPAPLLPNLGVQGERLRLPQAKPSQH